MVATRLQVIPHRNWSDIISQMEALPPPGTQRNLPLLGWQATPYWISNERDTRLHANTFRSCDQIFKVIDRQVKNKMQDFRDANPTLSSTMMQSWIRLSWHLSYSSESFISHDSSSSRLPFSETRTSTLPRQTTQGFLGLSFYYSSGLKKGFICVSELGFAYKLWAYKRKRKFKKAIIFLFL